MKKNLERARRYVQLGRSRENNTYGKVPCAVLVPSRHVQLPDILDYFEAAARKSSKMFKSGFFLIGGLNP